MRLLPRQIFAVSLTWFAALATTVRADPPDILHEFKFVTGKSTLQITGGFGGFYWPLGIDGTFGIVTGWELQHPPAYRRFAQFVDVKADLLDPRAWPLPSPATDLDDTLKLSSLDGKITTDGTLSFDGVENQGFPMHVDARQRGPLVVLTGSNQPDCCDHYSYRLRALGRGKLAADFNADGLVNQTDLATLNNHMGKTGHDFLLPTADYIDPDFEAAVLAAEHGDADLNGLIDGADFLIWQVELGGASPSMLASAAILATPIPEPAARLLAAMAYMIVVQSLRRTHPAAHYQKVPAGPQSPRVH
jgi:hypothetical protein